MNLWQPVPFAGGTYADETMPWTRQDTVNYLPTRAERSGARSDMILKQCPGMRIVTDLGNGPIRATYNVEGLLLAVSGDKLYRIGTDYIGYLVGTIPGVGRISVAHNKVANGNQVLFATGSSGYIYNTADGSLTPITDEGYPGAMCVRFIGQYFAQIEPQRRYWFISDLADGFSYNTLDTYEAEAQPDKLYSLESNAGRLFAFGERTIECYDNIVTENAAFQRSGIVIDRGVASGFATCVLDNAILFLGNDGVVYRMDGYNPVRISHHPLETALAASDLRRTFFTTWEDRGHKVAYLTLQDGNTWGYDVASQEWHRRQSYGLNRWRANTLTQWNGQSIAGDYANGKLYRLEWDLAREGFEPLVRERTFAVLHNDFNPVRVNAVRLLVDTGGQTPTLSISGNVPDGIIGESISGAYVANGGVPPYGNFTLLSGSLPPGILLNANGTYGGTFTTAGEYEWVVSVTDSVGGEASLTDTSTVASFWLTSRPYPVSLIETALSQSLIADELRKDPVVLPTEPALTQSIGLTAFAKAGGQVDWTQPPEPALTQSIGLSAFAKAGGQVTFTQPVEPALTQSIGLSAFAKAGGQVDYSATEPALTQSIGLTAFAMA